MEGSEQRPRSEAAQVRDYMTSSPQALEISATLLDAVLLIRKSGFRHIPILEHGQLVGILTERDLWRYTPTMLAPPSPQEYNRLFEETTVGKVMTREPRTIAPQAPLADAVELLFRNGLGCLPVIEDNQLVGIITVRDMLRALHDLLGPGAPLGSAA